jgi:hypothetical protein
MKEKLAKAPDELEEAAAWASFDRGFLMTRCEISVVCVIAGYS